MTNYIFPYWDETLTKKVTPKTRIIQLTELIKQQPIPDKIKLTAITDILWMVNNSKEVADSIRLDVINISKFGTALGNPTNIFSWTKSNEGYEFWWKMFQIINS